MITQTLKRMFAFGGATGTRPEKLKSAKKLQYNLIGLFSSSIQFLNYGYVEESERDSLLRLSDEEMVLKVCGGLYDVVAAELPLRGNKVLEVGSGRGGGAAHLFRTYEPRSLIGVDLSPRNVKLANRLEVPDALSFKQGDAENLPFEDESFDVVINVESSHCYPDFKRFLEEVERVLKPGGYLGWTDFIPMNALADYDALFEGSPLESPAARDVMPGVIRALDVLDDFKTRTMKHYPFLKGYLKEFMVTRESSSYAQFKSGEYVYLARHLRKPKSLH